MSAPDEVGELLARLNEAHSGGRLPGLTVIAAHGGGKISTHFTSYPANHPAETAGYLMMLCQDMAALISR